MKYLLLLPILFFLLPSSAEAAAFYADLSTTTCTGAGTSTSTAFCSIDAFADVARNAGDILYVKRGSATTTNITDVTFTSDGTLTAPIAMSADYDNLWGQFATSSQTVTVTQGSTTMPISASSTDIYKGAWIYIQGDCSTRPTTTVSTSINQCQFAYEVATATPSYIEFFFPYKGFQNGSAKNIIVMPPNPVWNTIAGDFQLLMNGDDFWSFKGMDFRGTDSACVIGIITNLSVGSSFVDLILQGNGSTDCAVGDVSPSLYYNKIRIFGTLVGFSEQATVGVGNVSNIFVDCNSVASSFAFRAAHGLISGNAVTVRNCTTVVAPDNGSGFDGSYFFRNLVSSVSPSGGPKFTQLFFEDLYGTPNLSVSSPLYFSTFSTTTVSTSTNLRPGGGGVSMYITPPNTATYGLTTVGFPNSYVKLFDYPIYSDGTAKTYTMYFQSASTSAFTSDPITHNIEGSSTPELFIECEYYADTVDADRVLKRSSTTNDVDFNGSTAWQDISLTCDPSQVGVLYFRGWYAKPKENPTNRFYMDTTPVISTP